MLGYLNDTGELIDEEAVTRVENYVCSRGGVSGLQHVLPERLDKQVLPLGKRFVVVG